MSLKIRKRNFGWRLKFENINHESGETVMKPQG